MARRETRRGGFDHGGWSFGYWDDAMGNWMGEAMGKPFALLLGRRTYEIFAAYWPHAGRPAGRRRAQFGDQVRRLPDTRLGRMGKFRAP